MITEPSLYRLMTWLSPAYPVGGFSYSHGLEHAVEAGQVREADGVYDWVATVLEQGAGRVDAALFAAAWRATTARDEPRLDELIELAQAWRGTAETALESGGQGAAFAATTAAVWPDDTLARAAARHPGRLTLAVAVAMAAGAQGIPLVAALTAYLQAFAANIVSAGVRLVPLGQTDGQRVLARLEPVVLRVTEAGIAADPDEVGAASPFVDWCSIRHETQYTRLFRS